MGIRKLKGVKREPPPLIHELRQEIFPELKNRKETFRNLVPD